MGKHYIIIGPVDDATRNKVTDDVAEITNKFGVWTEAEVKAAGTTMKKLPGQAIFKK